MKANSFVNMGSRYELLPHHARNAFSLDAERFYTAAQQRGAECHISYDYTSDLHGAGSAPVQADTPTLADALMSADAPVLADALGHADEPTQSRAAADGVPADGAAGSDAGGQAVQKALDLRLTPKEEEELNKYFGEYLPVIRKEREQIAQQLLGFCGMQLIESLLPASKKDYDSRSSRGNTSLGFFIMAGLDAADIDTIICQIDAEHQNFTRSFNHWNFLNIIVEQSGYREDLEGRSKSFTSRVAQKNSAHLRNHQQSGYLTVLFTRETASIDTLGDVTQFTEESIAGQLHKSFRDFTESRYPEISHSIFPDSEKKSALIFFLKTLSDGYFSELFIDMHLLLSYAAEIVRAFIALDKAGGEKDTIHGIAGKSLPVLGVPAYDGLFYQNSAKKKDSRYKNTFESWLTHVQPLQNRFLSSGSGPDVNEITACFEGYVKDSQYKKIKDSWVSAVLKNFVRTSASDSRSSGQIYDQLCHADWEVIRAALFTRVARKAEKKSLFDRTMELFKETASDVHDNMSAEDESLASMLLNKSASAITEQERNDLYCLHSRYRSILIKDKPINNSWEKLIYTGERINSDNFLVSLLRVISQHADTHDQEITRVTVKLNKNVNDALKINYQCAMQFSILYGPFLKSLSETLGNRIVFTCNSADDKAGFPLFNFNEFLRSRHGDSSASDTSMRSTVKDRSRTTLAFTVLIETSDDKSPAPRIIEWTGTPGSAGHLMPVDLELLASKKVKAMQLGTYTRSSELLRGNAQSVKLESIEGAGMNSGFFRPDASTEAWCNIHGCVTSALKSIEERIPKDSHSDADEMMLKDVRDIRRTLKDFTKQWKSCLASMFACSLNITEVRALSVLYGKLQWRIMNSSLISSSEQTVSQLALSMLELISMTGMAVPEKAAHLPARYLLENEIIESDSSWADTIFPAGMRTAAISTPFHPDSMLSLFSRNEGLCRMIRSVVMYKSSLSDHKQFSNFIENSEDRCWGPETIAMTLVRNTRQKGSTMDKSVVTACAWQRGYTLYDEIAGLQMQYGAIHGVDSRSGSFAITTDGSSASQYTIRLKRYREAFIRYLQRYISSRPYYMESCTVMIYCCGMLDLPLEIYEAIAESDELRSCSFRLIVVNNSLYDAQEIYRSFEKKRVQLSRNDNEGHFNRQVQVSVLASTAQSARSNDSVFKMNTYKSTGTYDKWLDLEILRTSNGEPDEEMRRMVDICLMPHVFDSRAQYRLTSGSVDVIPVSDEFNYCPSLISHVDFEHNSGLQAARFLTTPVLPLNLIIQNLSSVCIVENSNEHFAVSSDTLKKMLEQYDAQSSDGAAAFHYDAQFVKTPLMRQFIKDAVRDSGEVASLQNYAHNVIYIDDLMCRQSIDSNSHLIYFDRFRDCPVNFMVTTRKLNVRDMKFAHEMLNKISITDNDNNQCCSLISRDATVVSGSILMRALLRRKNTYEMTGLVLSRWLMIKLMSRLAASINASPVLKTPSFVSLDEFSALFSSGAANNQLSDLMGIQVLEYRQGHAATAPDGITAASAGSASSGAARSGTGGTGGSTGGTCANRYALILYIAESKFLDKADGGLAKKSRDQSFSTARLVYQSLSQQEDEFNLSQRQWLCQLMDMVSNSQTFSAAQLNLKYPEFARIAQLIRENQVDIYLRSLSCVFALHENSSAQSSVIFNAPSGSSGAPLLQMRISGYSLRNLFMSYISEQSGSDETLNKLLDHDTERNLETFMEDRSYIALHPLRLS